jgi:hypothetical protein
MAQLVHTFDMTCAQARARVRDLEKMMPYVTDDEAREAHNQSVLFARKVCYQLHCLRDQIAASPEQFAETMKRQAANVVMPK